MQPLRPYEKEDTLRQFLENDRRVLRFYCYWDDTDSMFGDPRECVLHYFLAYLEDDTIQVIERKVENSGIPQGTLIRRHRIPLPAPQDEEFYTVDHFNVGREIKMYSRVYHLTVSYYFMIQTC